jgi:S-adenosylmethionine synthetase
MHSPSRSRVLSVTNTGAALAPSCITIAQCLLVSQIGAPVTRPAMVAVVVMPDDRRAPELRKPIEAIVADRIARVPARIEDFVSGRIELF